MNTERINPFNELYVTETIPPEHFVSLFSPFLVSDAQDGLALFQPGNVILKGIQGSGKSMLLNLLKPEIQVAYKKADVDFPLPNRLRRFIGAGINLTRSVAVDFGQRAIEEEPKNDLVALPLYFGDFFNYWIVDDILSSIEKLRSECAGEISKELGITTDRNKFDNFAVKLSEDPCWFGYLKGVTDYTSLRIRISHRISIYRAFLNFNIQLEEEIKGTKSAIGEPISQTAEYLWDCGVVPKSVPFFIRIDQYEELSRLEDWSEGLEIEGLGIKYRRIVNKALGRRDPRISYRIGTRRYAWGDDLQVYGTSSNLELERDYKVVDIDEILRRKENRRIWVFPGFANDVFERRIKFAGYKKVNESLQRFLGDGLSPDEKAASYARTDKKRVVDQEWPTHWKCFFEELAEASPLSAKLAEAWARQAKVTSKEDQKLPAPPYQWDTRTWWRKERVQHALMHVASQYRQRMLWSGKDDVLALSGGNILVFVSLCQQIWSAWIRSTHGGKDQRSSIYVPEIDSMIQAVGIQMASTHWYNKIHEKTGKSNQRLRFINMLGRLFRHALLEDKSLSYPGHNGFSIRMDDLLSDSHVCTFLNDAVDYGDLFDAEHTTKMQDRKPRRKWYLNPILSPHFQLPVSHVKEPLYVSIDDVRKWIEEANRIHERPNTTSNPKAKMESNQSEPQLPLFQSDRHSK